jgi:hypothetical protein
MRYLLTIFFVVLLLPSVIGQDYVEEEITIEDYVESPVQEEAETTPLTSTTPAETRGTRAYRDEPLEVRRFDRDKWKEVIGDETFREEEVAEKKNKSSSTEGTEGDRRKEVSEDNSSATLNSSKPWSGAGLQVLSYAVIIAIVVLLIYIVLKNTTFSQKLKNRNIDTKAAGEEIDNIEEFETLGPLQQALADGNYRLAVRLYYLELLKNLHVKGLIRWQKDKTNRDYLNELFQTEFHYNEIRRLTLSYEEVYYGEHELPVQTLQQIITNFQQMDQKFESPNE